MRNQNINDSRFLCGLIELLTSLGVRATNTTSFSALFFATTLPLARRTYRALRSYSISPATWLLSVAIVAGLLVASMANLTAAAQTNNAATGQPTVSGLAEVGETLAANTDGISDADGISNVSFSYQWIRVDDGAEADIADATNPTYTTLGDDIGKNLMVQVSFTDDASNAEVLVSDPTDMVMVFISFESSEYTVREGQSVTIALLATGAPNTQIRIPAALMYAYGNESYFQVLPAFDNPVPHFGYTTTRMVFTFITTGDDVYKADKGNFGIFILKDDFQNPPGATLPKGYALADGEHKDINLIITYINIVEDELDPDANNAASGQPSITGTAKVGEDLTAEIGTIADADGVPAETEFSYQWFSVDAGAETEISGATGKTYTVASVDEGKTLKVQVSFTDDVGYEESVTSAETSTVLPEAPGAPQNLTATEGDTKATLSWEAPISGGAPTSYQYRQSDDDGANWSEWEDIAGSDGATATYAVTNLTNNTTYTFQVRGVNAGGEGIESNSATAIPAIPDAPGAPQNLAATSGNQRVELDWGAPNDGGTPDSYQYRHSDDGGMTWSEWANIPDSDESTASHIVEDLENDTNYEFQVRGINSGGQGDESSTADATPVLPDAPGSVVNLKVEAGDGQVMLTWDPALTGGAPDSFEYSYLKQPAVDWIAWTEIPGSDSSTSSHFVTGLENSVFYTFDVRGVNAGGPGASSSDFPFARPLPALPGAPVNLTATAGDTEVTLNWATPTDGGPPSRYVYHRSEDGGNSWHPWETMTDSDGATTSYTVTGLTNGIANTFEILAYNDGGDGPVSNQATATPLPPLPDAPFNLQANAGYGEVTLVWDLPTTGGPASHIEYRHSTDGGVNWDLWTTVTGSDSDTTSYTVSDLTFGVEYTFEVQTSNLAGESGSSNRSSATPLQPGLRVDVDATSDDLSTVVHSGTSDRPTVVVKFSEPVATFNRHTPSIEITDGYLLSVSTHDDSFEPNDWLLTIVPTSTADVSVTFVADEPCANGGICTTNDDLLEVVPQNPHVIEFDSAPIVIGAWTSGDPGVDGEYETGDYVLATVRFDKPVVVGRSPTLEISVSGVRRTIYWGGGSGSRELVFGYFIPTADNGAASVTVVRDSIDLNGGTLQSLRGTDASLTFTRSPYVTTVTVLEEESGDWFWTHADPSETIVVEVEFSETVTVNTTSGTPTIGILIGGTEVQAEYVRGSGTDTLDFEYAVAATDGSAGDGWVGVAKIVVESLNANGGTIKDRSNNDADLKHGGHHAVWQLVLTYAEIDISTFDYEYEDSGNAIEFEVTLDRANMYHVSVSYEIIDVSTTAGTDYVQNSGTLRFYPGQTSKTISIELYDDEEVENSETFKVRLSNPQYGRIDTSEAIGYIFDDD